MWTDIAMIVFICTTANHLGLIGAIEETLHVKLPIINCAKCFTMWATFSYTIKYGLIDSLAISFLASYTAVWLELAEGVIDKLYSMIYDKVYSTEGEATNE